jgi:hypothetical protein
VALNFSTLQRKNGCLATKSLPRIVRSVKRIPILGYLRPLSLRRECVSEWERPPRLKTAPRDARRSATAPSLAARGVPEPRRVLPPRKVLSVTVKVPTPPPRKMAHYSSRTAGAGKPPSAPPGVSLAGRVATTRRCGQEKKPPPEDQIGETPPSHCLPGSSPRQTASSDVIR